MTTYSYLCPACQHEEEHKETRIPDVMPRITCPKCKTLMNLKLSPPQICFKGPGWTGTTNGG